MTFSRSFAALLSLFCVLARAQNGDHTNEVQHEVVAPGLIPPAPVRSPEEEAKTFAIAPGFRIELVAAEPLVTSPVAVQFDHRGRLWVVEMNGYMPTPDGQGEGKPSGNIVVLEDTDGDGRMDKRTVFLSGLVMPRSLMLFHDGVIVAEPPRLWFARDTDGDGKADEKLLVADDYAAQDDPRLGDKANPEHASNSPTWILDNWVYSANHTWRYRWLGGSPTNWIKEPTVFRGQWGLSQDNYGRLFHNSNSDPLRADLVESRYFSRNPNLRNPYGVNVQLEPDMRVWTSRVNPGVNRGYQPGQLTPDGKLATYTGACGPVVYRGNQFGPEYVSDVFLCEPTGNLVRRERITNRDGVLSATNAYDHAEFLTATDERFRPINLHNGPDGALYVVDFYRGLIQHHIYLTSYLRKQIESRHLQTPVNLGRIWRVVKADQPVSRESLPAQPSEEQLLAKLSHPNGWWRDRAQQMLVERRATSAVPRLRQLALADQNPSPLGRLHALWTLEGLGQLDLPTLQTAIDDPAPKVRGSVLRLGETFLKGPDREEAINLVLRRAGFIPLEEQLQLMLTLGEIRTPATETITKVLLMNSQPSQLRFDAVISGLAGRELEFLQALVLDPVCATMKTGHGPLLTGLARCVGYEAVPDRVAQLLEMAASRPDGSWQQLALLDGLAGLVPLARPGQPAPVIKPILLPEASKGLLALRTVDSPEVKSRVTRLEPFIVWPGKPGAGPLPAAAVALRGEEAASFARGKVLYTTICGTCHQPHGNGQAGLAPPLRDSEWVLGSEQRLARIVLHGLRDEVSVKGVNYQLNMPALAEALTDEQIADALTYVRHEWEHNATPVKAATVKAVRATTGKREDSWTQAELLKVP
ncbi:MAG TPA: PVC-type heme-binding CxxCH protein [Candidatus Limnocylindria bacterium]|nr:PVC-type heme-binding CxxCH protein [Candidatus Limnocylindria bacterium]